MKVITDRQREVLVYLLRYSTTYHCSPTTREVSQYFDIASPQGAARHLAALVKKGYMVPIIGGNGVRRGFRLLEAGIVEAGGHNILPMGPPSPVNPKKKKGKD